MSGLEVPTKASEEETSLIHLRLIEVDDVSVISASQVNSSRIVLVLASSSSSSPSSTVPPPAAVATKTITRKSTRKALSESLKRQIFNTTSGVCYLCKTKMTFNPVGDEHRWEIEHIVAFSNNPDENDVFANMLPSCMQCNRGIGGKFSKSVL
jgi:5-methylcytosine-specific restriction endonuclease McrA